MIKELKLQVRHDLSDQDRICLNLDAVDAEKVLETLDDWFQSHIDKLVLELWWQLLEMHVLEGVDCRIEELLG